MPIHFIEMPSALSDSSELARAQLLLSRCEAEARFARLQISAIRLGVLFERLPELTRVSYAVNPITRKTLWFDTNLRADMDRLANLLPSWGEEDPEEAYERLQKANGIAIPELSDLFEMMDPRARAELAQRPFERHKEGESPVESAMRQMLSAEDFSRWQSRLLDEKAQAPSAAAKRRGL